MNTTKNKRLTNSEAEAIIILANRKAKELESAECERLAKQRASDKVRSVTNEGSNAPTESEQQAFVKAKSKIARSIKQNKHLISIWPGKYTEPDSIGPTPTEYGDRWAQADALAEALNLILPMAKGYALAHQVGNNQAFIEQAEAALAQHKEQVT